MGKTSILLALLLALLLSACAGTTPTPPVIVTQNSNPSTPSSGLPGAYPIPVTGEPLATPYPAAVTPSPPSALYPAPTGSSIGMSAMPLSSYAPQPGDSLLMREGVNLDMAGTELLISGTMPDKATVNLSGTLPDPCHQLRIQVSPPDSQNKIFIQVYSVVDPQTVCIMVIKSFQVSVPLDNLKSGHYIVLINGQLLGEFDQ